jgi:hypothetical protein
VALISDTGVLLLRQPYDNGRIGASMRDSELYRHYAQLRGTARTGSRFFHSLHDGELRLNSFRPLEHYPLFVTAALSREEMLERWRRDTFTLDRGGGAGGVDRLFRQAAGGPDRCASRPRPSCARRATR